MLVVLVLPVVFALSWGRTAQRRQSYPAPPEQDPLALAPSQGTAPLGDLEPSDRDWLARLLIDSLRAPAEGRNPPDGANGPDACRRPFDAAVFVTLYLPGQAPMTAVGRAGTLADSTLAVARTMGGREEFRRAWSAHLDRVRVRFDIVTEQTDLARDAREQYYAMAPGAPVGVVLLYKGRLHAVLPGDLAGPRAGKPADALRTLVREAGLREESWRMASLRMALLRALTFVNAAPGGTQCVPAPQGVPLVSRPALVDVQNGCRLAAGYLAGRWYESGGGPPPDSMDAASGAEFALGEPGNARALHSHARAAAALARMASWDRDEGRAMLAAAAVAWAAERVEVPKAWPSVAYVKPAEPDAPARLEDAAAVLELCCAYRAASGDASVDDLTRRLALFLLLMQRKDGRFNAAYDRAKDVPADGPDGRPVPAGAAEAADAASAMLAAYGTLSMEECLLGGQRALLALAGPDEALTGRPAQRFVVAVGRYAHHAPATPFLAAVERAAGDLAARQLGPAQAASPDLVGASAYTTPLLLSETAADLEALASGWLIGALEGGRPGGPPGIRRTANAWSPSEDPAGALRNRCRSAAVAAGRYVLQFQYTPLNGYYLPDLSRALGGVRLRPGSNLVTIECVANALCGLDQLREAMEADVGTSP